MLGFGCGGNCLEYHLAHARNSIWVAYIYGRNVGLALWSRELNDVDCAKITITKDKNHRNLHIFYCQNLLTNSELGDIIIKHSPKGRKKSKNLKKSFKKLLTNQKVRDIIIRHSQRKPKSRKILKENLKKVLTRTSECDIINKLSSIRGSCSLKIEQWLKELM